MKTFHNSKNSLEPIIKITEDNSCKKYQLKCNDNQYYNIEISFQEKSESIIFKAKPIGDLPEIIYKKIFNLNDFYNLNRFFRQYLTIQELYSSVFINMKNKDLSIIKNKNTINLNFIVLSLNKKEIISIHLNEEKILMEKMIKRLCQKINNTERLYKLNKNNISDKQKICIIFILIIIFLLSVVNITFIYKEKIYLNNIKIQFQNEINTIKNQIKEMNQKLPEITKCDNKLFKEVAKLDLLNYKLHKNNAFDLINEGLKHKLNKKIESYQLIYKASKDGFKAKDFHRKCDWKQNTVTFILTKEGKFFGGFTDMYWDSESDAKEGSNGFIFSLDNKEIFYNINLKFNIRCIAEYGPIFGNFDIGISDDCNINNKSYFNSYAYDTKGKERIFSENKFFVVEDYEVYELFFE